MGISGWELGEKRFGPRIAGGENLERNWWDWER